MKAFTDNIPPLIEEVGNGSVNLYFCTKEVTIETHDEEGSTRTQYESYTATVWKPLSYAKLVDAIIGSRYSGADMQAIINNHLLGTEDDDCDDHESEYNEMQQWRKMAKQTAKEALEKMEGLKN